MSFSCQRTESTQVSQPEEIEVEIEEEIAANTVKMGYVLRLNAGFYSSVSSNTGSETDTVRWLASLALGESVITGETRRATLTSDNRVYDFIEVTRDTGVAGFALVSQVASDGQLAVVVDERANLFRAARAIDVSNVILSQKTILVCHPETESEGYIRVSGFDPVNNFTVRQENSFVRLSSISRRPSDIQSSIYLQTALVLREADAVRRAALLDSALLYYPDSVFFNEINELVNPNITSVIQTEPYRQSGIVVLVNNAEVRDIPDLVVGVVLDHLNQWDNVLTIERTTNTFTVSGQSDHWYKISFPLEGWIFGANLTTQ